MLFKHALKTAVAAVLATLIYEILHLPQGYWAVVSAVIVMQANVGGSLKASWSRLIGTAIGALLGTVALAFLGSNAGSLGITLILIVLLCGWLKIEESYRLAGVTATIVILAGTTEPWQIGWHRFLDVSLGIGIALLVTVFLFPSYAKTQLQQNLIQVMQESQKLYQTLTTALTEGDYPKETIAHSQTQVIKGLQKNYVLMQEHHHEIIREFEDDKILMALITDQERILEHLLAIDEAIRGTKIERFRCELFPQLCQMIDAIEQGLGDLIAALANQRKPIQLDELEAIRLDVKDELSLRRQAGIFREYSMDQVLSLFSFFYSLNELAKDILKIADRIERL